MGKAEKTIRKRYDNVTGITAEWFCWLSYLRFSLISRLNYTLKMANMMFVFVEEI